ncbi:MAG: UDP-2,3-diacylglucosamine diphosphatase [Beijerinckiaceae bacterium]|jgi:UDP-2,3-diacylglucosamine pyrophosphatase LpxH|nr:UDP-2,3-diacylglucosamine diphosphatase [Beijerinckiaceae bacterium]
MNRYRAIFISDVHLGTRTSQVDALLDFLKHTESDMIYLVGDIVDGWRLKKSWYWPQSHNDVVQKLLRKGRKGTRIVLVPGNHDEFLRDFQDSQVGGIEIADRTIHEGADGRRYLVIHGDQFDAVVMHAKWLAFVGDWAYEIALVLNNQINFIRRRLGLTYWSFSAWAKHSVKKAVNFISAFEETLSGEARRQQADGVICGHIHHAAIREISGIHYMNCGDWVESSTALVERQDGQFEIIAWNTSKAALIAAADPEGSGAAGSGKQVEPLAA